MLYAFQVLSTACELMAIPIERIMDHGSQSNQHVVIPYVWDVSIILTSIYTPNILYNASYDLKKHNLIFFCPIIFESVIFHCCKFGHPYSPRCKMDVHIT